jgi:hypothetical protein
MDPSSPEETFDPARRKLCPDGACIGVIGDDGVCSECGRTEAQAAAGDERAGAADAGGSLDDVAPGDGAAPGGGFDPKRRLCDDESCVGVVGDDGLCRVCGRRAA